MLSFLNKKSTFLIALITVIIILIIFRPNIFVYFQTSQIDVNDAKNIITLLTQIEAAVMAILISLSLIAVQLAAQSYSTRVIETFKKYNFFKFIVVLYIGLIVYNIIILVVINVKFTWESRILYF